MALNWSLSHLPLDEKWNVYTHAFGALISLVGGICLLYGLEPTTGFALLGVGIYVFSMVFLFAASAIYHGVPPHRQAFWQKMDHIGIYILIAGTYTPVALTTLLNSSGPYLLSGVWSIALLGTVYKVFLIDRFKNLSLFLYLAMGWMVVLDFENIRLLFPNPAFYALVSGGFFYTAGTIFYRWESLYFHHVIWHFFVLAGAFSHFLMVIFLIG
ncbi:MAG: PAQR family membrane homeostasis protein TrhA [Flavobacteriaceae bacterium]